MREAYLYVLWTSTTPFVYEYKIVFNTLQTFSYISVRVSDILFFMALIPSDHARLEANRWLVWGRLLYVSSILLLYGAAMLLYAFSVYTFVLPRRGIIFFSFAYASSLLMWVCWYLIKQFDLREAIRWMSGVQIALDIILITFAALVSEEPLFFLFMLVPIISSSLLWESRAPAITALLALTPTLIYVTYADTIVTYTRAWGFFFDVSIRLPVFTFAAVLTGVTVTLTVLAIRVGGVAHERALLLEALQNPNGRSSPPKQEKVIVVDDASKRLIQAKEFEVEKANERLATLARAKSDFVTVATHQLRTPLAGIRWSLDMLIKKNFGEMNPEQVSVLEKGLVNTEQMIRIVNDILNLDKIDNDQLKMTITPGDLYAVIEGAVAGLTQQATIREVRIEYHKPDAALPKFPMDADKIRMVMDNLIDNAVRYSKDGGVVRISVDDSKATSSSNPIVIVSVSDDGIGIPESDRGEMFTKFYRASNARRQDPNGNGIGLFVVKSIIEGHHGNIWYESKEGEGTNFHFSLPLR